MAGLSGYLESPPDFTKTASSGILSFARDLGTFSLGGPTIINHDLVITYKLTDVGDDANIGTLPGGGTTLRVAIVDGTDTIIQTPAYDPHQVDILALRKFTNGVHDTIILRGRAEHSNGDQVRIKFFVTDAARINCFSVSWRMSSA